MGASGDLLLPAAVRGAEKEFSLPRIASPCRLPLRPDKGRFPEKPTYLVVSGVMWLRHLINQKPI